MLVGDNFVSTVKLDGNNDSDDKMKHPSSLKSRAQCGRWKRASYQNVFQAAGSDFKCAPG